MNRRDVMVTGIGAAILSGIGDNTAWAQPASWIGWGPGARQNRHADLALGWIGEQIKAGEMFIGTEVRLLDTWVVLEQPKFLIETGQPVWNYMVGHTDEAGLSISVWSRGQRIGASRVASNFDSYIIPPAEQGYLIRTVCISYEDEKRLEGAGVTFRRDMPWFLKANPAVLKSLPPRV